MASRVSLGQARSAEGSRPRHIMSTEFDALWGSLEPLGNTWLHFGILAPPKARPRPRPRLYQGFGEAVSEKIRAEARLPPKARPRRIQEHRPRLTAQGPPKASPKAPPKAPSPKASLGQALGRPSSSSSFFIFLLLLLLLFLFLFFFIFLCNVPVWL